MKRRTACGLLALGALSRLGGEDSPWDAATKEGLDALEQGHLKEARDGLTLALDHAKKANAGESIVAGCIDNLALATDLKGHQQEKLYRESLKIRERHLKPDDPEIALSLTRLASAVAYPTAGSNGTELMAEAQGMLQRVFKIAEADAEGQAMAEVLETTGIIQHSLLARQKKYSELSDKVEPLYRRSLAIRVNRPSDGDLEYAKILELISVLLRQTGRADEALTLAIRATPIRQRHIQKLSPKPAPASGARTELFGAFRIGNGVSPPSLVTKIEPTYAELPRQVMWQGAVSLQTVIGESGIVDSVSLTRSLGLGLDEQAWFAVRDWVFRPGQKENVPVRVIANIEVNFRLL